VSFWDPFFLHLNILPTVQYIASDNVFRTPVLGTVMRLLGSIPTSKFKSDIGTIAQVLRVIKNNGVVGVFPEGRRTWDGNKLDHVPTVTKLIHRLRLPVVGVLIRGGYLSNPRWGRHIRHGKVEIEYRMIFSQDELKHLSQEEAHRLMTERLAHDEIQWQRRRMIPFIGKSPAEYIERVLFTCPKCKNLKSIRSRGDIATCTVCGYSFRYNQYGFLEPVSGPLIFNTVSEWNHWQLEHHEEMLRGLKDPQAVIIEENRSILLQGYRTRPLRKINTGRATISLEGITFTTTIGKKIFFPLKEINGENVQNGEKLEFYRGNTLYRLNFVNVRESAFMWYQTIYLLHKIMREKEQEVNSRVNA
jgi:1-acyl-sn-glycerol-3-phosphate acyltransferase